MTWTFYEYQLFWIPIENNIPKMVLNIKAKTKIR
jgi:hypothetical protein